MPNVDTNLSGGLKKWVFFVYFIIDKKGTHGRAWIGRFWMSRFLRIFAVYYIFLALTVYTFEAYPVTRITSYEPVFENGSAGSIVIYLFSTLFILGQDILRMVVLDTSTGDLLFHPAPADYTQAMVKMSGTAVIGQAWSLSTELMFFWSRRLSFGEGSSLP